MKNRIDRGVAGRSMATVESAQKAYEDPARQRPARERVRVVLGNGGRRAGATMRLRGARTLSLDRKRLGAEAGG